MGSPDCLACMSPLINRPSPFSPALVQSVRACVMCALRLSAAHRSFSCSGPYVRVRVLFSVLAYLFVTLQIKGRRGKVLAALVVCVGWCFTRCVCFARCYILPLSLELQCRTTHLPAAHAAQGDRPHTTTATSM